MIEEGRALFLQIAESVEDSIVDGSLAEEAQAPSTNELAAFHRINPATAGKHSSETPKVLTSGAEISPALRNHCNGVRSSSDA